MKNQSYLSQYNRAGNWKRTVPQRANHASSSNSQPNTSRGASLTSSPADGPASQPKRKFFSHLVAYLDVTQKLLEDGKRLCKAEFQLEFVPRDLKIRTSNTDDYTTISSYLGASNVKFYSFDTAPRDSIKFLLRGLPMDIQLAEVHSALASHDITPIHIHQLTKTVDNPTTQSRDTSPLPLWVIAIAKSVDSVARLKAVTGLLHLRVRIEDYRGRSAIQQCFRCQKFARKANFCHMAPRCAKYAKDHNTRDCPDPEPVIAAPKCATCNGDHHANFSGCPELQKFQRTQRPRPSPPGFAPQPSAFPPEPWNKFRFTDFGTFETPGEKCKH